MAMNMEPGNLEMEWNLAQMEPYGLNVEYSLNTLLSVFK